ncbi:MAG: transcriptional regulator NrdR [Acidobacteria bacterium]|nr:MAG: transcriptional regulator NrdR [Acidobacteriota bacterium]RLE24550.1 MAG: transcriptional regulator NrdR [Acidobacteriota bacterium]
MQCPFCKENKDKVVDSREVNEGRMIRRRRECLECHRRFTTYERIEEMPYLVIKKDGRREEFDRKKLLGGILRACEKRPVEIDKIEAIVDDIIGKLYEVIEREIPSVDIGEIVMDRLKTLDSVAYVRFASVYREFKDVDEFMQELQTLVRRRKK